MAQLTNRFGLGSLLCCVASCALILVLMLASRPPSFSGGIGGALEYLLLVAPYVALAIASALTRRSPFFSGWVFACSVVLTGTNPNAYFLAWYAFVLRWPVRGLSMLPFSAAAIKMLVGLLGGGPLVRAFQLVLQRMGVSEKRRHTATWTLGIGYFCLIVGYILWLLSAPIRDLVAPWYR
jgi:hypothetical protein